MLIALIGNQNSGKTTLFNALTGSNQHVGNFPGVTIEKKIGWIKDCNDICVVDLPGIYSLSPFTDDEVLTRDFLISQKPDFIINVIDASNIERNLYLSLQLMDLQIPMVMAFNMMDELNKNKVTVDIKLIEKFFGVRVFPICEPKGESLSELISAIASFDVRESMKIYSFYEGSVLKAFNLVVELIYNNAEKTSVPLRFAAAKIIEGDSFWADRLKLDDNQLNVLSDIVGNLERETGVKSDEALARMRYSFIQGICDFAVKRDTDLDEVINSRFCRGIDRILTNKYLGIPIFLFIMFVIFQLSFNFPGGWIGRIFSYVVDTAVLGISDFLASCGINPVFYSLIVNGVFKGISGVLSFLPVIIILFIFLSFLEDSGYMARVAFLMDKFLRKIGLSGRAFVPLLIGFGCSVPAIMASRTLVSRRDKIMTVFLIPFVSCSAKLPVYAFFSDIFFPKYKVFIIFILYFIGIFTGLLIVFLVNHLLLYGDKTPFIMEMPPYRMPSVKSVGILVMERSKDFIFKVFTVIFYTSIFIWFLQTFDFNLNIVDDTSKSMVGVIGNFLAPLFSPLGFRDGRLVISLIAGFSAKEAVVGTLEVLFSSAENLSAVFSPVSAFCFLIFVLLYTPCVSAVGAAGRELGSLRLTLCFILFHIFIAYVISCAFYGIIMFFV